MKQNWSDYEAAAEKGPLPVFWKALVALLIVFGVMSFVAYGFGWVGETARVAQEEFGPRAALDKYTWFKDAAAGLDKKQADVKVYGTRIASLDKQYEGVPRTKWAREDREQRNVWESELAGVKASYNQLAAEYNAKMAEFHWRFAERGTLPPGASDPLPREYKPYKED